MDADELHMSDAMGGPFDMDAYRRTGAARSGLPAVSSRHDITMMANSDSTSDLLKLDRSQPIGEGVDFELFDIFHSTTSELGFTGVPGLPHDDTNQFLSHALGSVASPDIHNKLRGQGSHSNLSSIRSSPQPLNFPSNFTSNQQSQYNSTSFIKHDQTLPSHDSPISPHHQTSQQHPTTRVTFNPTTFHSRESPTSHLFSPTSPNTGIPSLEPASLFPTSTNPLTPHTPVTPITPGGTRIPSSSPPTHPSNTPHHPSLIPSNHNLPNISHSSESSSKRITTKIEARSPSPTSPFDSHDSAGISATPSSSTYSSPYYNGNSTSDRTSIKNEMDDLNDKNGNSKSRLARKAELARASRRRKKMYVQDLEAKVKKLGAKIEELQQKQAQAKSKRLPASITREEKERKESQKQIRAQLSEITSRKTLDKETQQRLNELVRRFVQNSRERQATVDFYLDRVEDCLTPGLQVKFALWGLDQSDEFYEKPGLWSSLMSKEVGLTEAQLQVVMSKRKYVRQERRALAQCEQMLREVREAITGHLRSLNHHIDEIQNVMTPLQLAKFYMWVENNEWCMQMLNTMFTTPTQQAAAAAAMQQAALSQTSSSTSMTQSQ